MRFRFHHAIFVSAAIACGIFSVSVQGQNDALNRDLAAQFSRVQVVPINADKRRLDFTIDGRGVSIDLRENDIRSADSRTQLTDENGRRDIARPAANTFIGIVEGEPNAVARFSVADGRFVGLFETRGVRYFLESASAFSRNARAGEHVLYRIGDLTRHDPISCGSHLLDKVERASDYAAQNAAPTAMRRLELATEADFEYVTTHGGVAGANSEILGVLNVVDGLYEAEIGISIAVVFQHAWTTSDPFAAANAENTARNFQAYWNANFPTASFPRDTAQLFSGKANVLGQGWAFISVVCNQPNFAYGMSGYVNFAEGQRLVTAHEIAHNLGANHVDAPQGCANTLMNSSLTGATPLTFCQFSRNEIANHLAANGACVSNAASCPFDFDGDAKTDLSIFRPAPGQWWYSRSTDGGARAFTFGNSTDRLVPADYTGDGKTDIAVWRPSSGQWFVLRSEDAAYYSFTFGTNGDIPAPGDFDADGKADAAIYRPSGGTWFIARSSDGGTTVTNFGTAGDVPVNADYDGDSRSDIAIYRPSNGQWWMQRSTAGLLVVTFGTSGDRTVQGDYTGDGKADVAIYRPSSGSWFILHSENLGFYSFPFGTTGDVPSPGDYDGDGKNDAAVFRPSSSTWFAQRTTGGTLIQQFGLSTDTPIPSAYVR